MGSIDRVVPEVVLQMDTPAEWFWIDPKTAGCRIWSGPCVYEIHFTRKTAWESLVACIRAWRRRPRRTCEIVRFPQRAH